MLIRIIAAVIGLPVVLLFLFILPVGWSAVFASALSLIAVYELLYRTGMIKSKFVVSLSCLTAVFIPPALHFGLNTAIILFVCFAVTAILFVYGMMNTESFKFSSLCSALFAYIVIPVFFSMIPSILSEDNGRFLIVLPFLCAWSCDTFAYFTGVAIGKHKLIEHISAKKTIEGSVGGILGAVITMTLYAFILSRFFDFTPCYPCFIILALVGSVISQIGDLSMSYIKREYHIKDYGNLIPGHGGILDRFDSVLFVLPTVYAAVAVFKFI